MPGQYCGSSAMEMDAVRISGVPDQFQGSCVVKLKADLNQLMITFNYLSLTCGQYIKLYYKSDSTGKPDVSLANIMKGNFFKCTNKAIFLFSRSCVSQTLDFFFSKRLLGFL
jgi:hypothetical protein